MSVNKEKTLWKSEQVPILPRASRRHLRKVSRELSQRDKEVSLVRVVVAGLGLGMGKRVLAPWKGLAKAQSCYMRVVS